MQPPGKSRGLRLVPGVPDGSDRPEPSVSLPSGLPRTDGSDEGQQLDLTLHKQRAAEQFSSILSCLVRHGYYPTEARVFPGGFVVRVAEDVEPVSPATPGAGVHEPSSPSAAPEIPFRAGDGDEGP